MWWWFWICIALKVSSSLLIVFMLISVSTNFKTFNVVHNLIIMIIMRCQRKPWFKFKVHRTNIVALQMFKRNKENIKIVRNHYHIARESLLNFIAHPLFSIVRVPCFTMVCFTTVCNSQCSNSVWIIVD